MIPDSSLYVNSERRSYSIYVLQSRAIPHAADGLKSAGRRILWIGRNGSTYKSATLAGATMPLHPHSAPEDAVNTLAAFYKNNIPLLKGDGAFGTLLKPTAYGASRYTSVKVSEFTKDVVFRDIEIIPMQDNYDSTQQEPVHFLPLVPIVLLNPQKGIAVGFSSDTLPRTLNDIIKSQISVLENKRFAKALPTLEPIDQAAYAIEDGKAKFAGAFSRTGATTLKITNLPYGITHEKYRTTLDKLEDSGTILEYIDNSRDKYNIDVRFKRGILSKSSDDEVLSLLGLYSNVSENLTVINFDGETVWNTNYQELIREFCEWRLEWYVPRFERLSSLLEVDIQKYKDILLTIRKNVGGLAKKIKSKGELKEFLETIGVIYVDYISDLQVYRFTEEEKRKVEERLKAANATLREYKSYLKSESKRRQLYITELKEILSNFKKGKYR